MTTLTIGRLAEEAGVTVETVRYYERRALIDPPVRTQSGYRSYSDVDVARLRFVRRAKDLGFTLAEIRELVSVGAEQPDPILDVTAKATARLFKLDREVQILLEQRCRLRQLLEICDHGDGASCVALMIDTHTADGNHD
jgi:MerR family transcriptional regulator, copper efflux regulator